MILVTMVTKWSQRRGRAPRNSRNRLNWMVARNGIEPPTRGFSVQAIRNRIFTIVTKSSRLRWRSLMFGDAELPKITLDQSQKLAQRRFREAGLCLLQLPYAPKSQWAEHPFRPRALLTR